MKKMIKLELSKALKNKTFIIILLIACSIAMLNVVYMAGHYPSFIANMEEWVKF